MASQSPFAQPPLHQAPANKSNVWVIIAIVGGVLAVSLLICVGVLTALLLPAVSSARHAAHVQMSRNNMKMIGLALHNYHDTFKSLPPAYSTDEAGKPLLSWRVTILPFLENEPLYQQFHLDEPWDSPHNQPLLDQMPEAFRSPSRAETTPHNETSYVAIRGENSSFPASGEAVRFRDCTDGLSNTIAAAEVTEATVPWTKPDDITPAQLYQEISGSAPPGTNVLFLDGSVRTMAPSVEQGEIEALTTRSAGDTVF